MTFPLQFLKLPSKICFLLKIPQWFSLPWWLSTKMWWWWAQGFVRSFVLWLLLTSTFSLYSTLLFPPIGTYFLFPEKTQSHLGTSLYAHSSLANSYASCLSPLLLASLSWLLKYKWGVPFMYSHDQSLCHDFYDTVWLPVYLSPTNVWGLVLWISVPEMDNLHLNFKFQQGKPPRVSSK